MYYAHVLAIVTMPFVFILLVSMIIILSVISVIISLIMMSFLIARNIFAFVPIIVHKENWLVAGVVSATILVPMFGLLIRNAQINRLLAPHRSTFNNHRLSINHSWLRVVADIKNAIMA